METKQFNVASPQLSTAYFTSQLAIIFKPVFETNHPIYRVVQEKVKLNAARASHYNNEGAADLSGRRLNSSEQI